jgi:tRNA1Val (adenine37-N6)-methyltransferase
LARFADAIPFEELIEAADLLLSENGIFSVIIPFKEEENFIALAHEYELHPFKSLVSKEHQPLKSNVPYWLLAEKKQYIF